MKKYKMMAGALAFSLCSFISYAGSPGEDSAWGSEGISFNERNSLPATEAPSRWNSFKKATPSVPSYGGRTTLTIKPRIEAAPQSEVSLLHPENHLCEVSVKRTEYTYMGRDKKTQKDVWTWLPIENGKRHADKNNFEIAADKAESSLGYGFKYKKEVGGKLLSKESFQTTGILTSNQPFIDGKKNKEGQEIKAENYFAHVIDKFNDLDGAKQKLNSFFRRNTGLNLGKDVELKWAKKGSEYQTELAKMDTELKNSDYYWQKGTKGKTELSFAGDLGVGRASSLKSEDLFLEKYVSHAKTLSMMGISSTFFNQRKSIEQNIEFYNRIWEKYPNGEAKDVLQYFRKQIYKELPKGSMGYLEMIKH